MILEKTIRKLSTILDNNFLSQIVLLILEQYNKYLEIIITKDKNLYIALLTKKTIKGINLFSDNPTLEEIKKEDIVNHYPLKTLMDKIYMKIMLDVNNYSETQIKFTSTYLPIPAYYCYIIFKTLYSDDDKSEEIKKELSISTLYNKEIIDKEIEKRTGMKIKDIIYDDLYNELIISLQ